MGLSGWNVNKKLKLVIDSSKVDEDLINFPINITLSSGTGQTGFDATAVFEELSTVSGTKKIAVTTTVSGVETELYTEIERWDWANEEANLWVKVPTVSSGTNTKLYLYYDSDHIDNTTYIGGVDDLSYQMVIDKGTEGTYDTTHVRGPSVIKESDTSYKMWYAGHDGTNWRILYATSTNGIIWSNYQMVINTGAEGTYDTVNIIGPSVIKESDTSYKIWYAGSDGSNWRILYATSTNGITWSNYQMVINIGAEVTYDTTHVRGPSVIKESDTSYKIWYAGSDGSNWRILYATSTNGITWTGHQMVVNIGAEGTYDTTHAFSPCVIKESDTSYKIWYGGNDGTTWRILYATSTNGITWIGHQMVVNIGAEGTYDTVELFYPCIIYDSGSYKMWYDGAEGTNIRIFYSPYWSTNVWDNNFVGIWHMAQDPNGDVADSIKDSTSNANHGTPAGSMISADLVDGKVGKAIDFDGNDSITITADASLKFGTSDFTIESTFKTASADSMSLLSYGDRADNPGWTAYIGADGVAKFILDDATTQVVTSDVANHADNSFHYYSATLDRDSNCVINVDAAIVATENISGANLTLDTIDHDEIVIARAWYNLGYTVYYTGIIDEIRISNIARSPAWIKATYHSNWDDFVIFSDIVTFVFTNPTPTHLSTVYGTTKQLYLTTTISGEEQNYVYDADFYDSFDVQIGTTVSSINSGQPAESNAYLSTPSGIDYSWYMTASSSGVEDTSETYTFHNRFLASGTTEVNGVLTSGIGVRLYLRDTGELLGSTTSTISGTFNIETQYNAEFYCVALSPYTDTNSLIYDFLEVD